MGRRSNHSREELQEMVLKAARVIVVEEGIRALTTRKIATKIGYTVGTLYHFFKNLDDIVVHMNAVTLDMLYKHLEKCEKEGGRVLGVKALAYGYLDFSTKHFAEWQVLFEYPLPEGIKYPEGYEERINRIFNLVEQTLRARIRLSAENASRTARILWSGVHGLCSLHHKGKLHKTQSEDVRVLIDTLILYYLAGLQRDMR